MNSGKFDWSSRPLYKTVPMQSILEYEAHSSWWMEYVSLPWFQGWVSRYLAWKVRRKYNRYIASITTTNQLIYSAGGGGTSCQK